jgi:hypothetical protein
MSKTMAAARGLALHLGAEPFLARPPDGRRREKFLVLGDPQARLERVLSALEHQGALGEDGYLRPELGLVSMGDHFDFRLEGQDPAGLVEGQRDGLALLRWLAQHPPDQVFILGGNHDFARVMELAHETEASWAQAQALVATFDRKVTPAQRTAFAAAFPRIPTPGMVRGDYAMFSVAQRELVQALLLGRRMRLALTARTGDGTEVLLTHAGVTLREQELLGVAPGAGPLVVGRALETLLDHALLQVEAHWRSGRAAALSLAPVNVSGSSGQEGGGFLNHRPVHPEWPDLARDWAWRAESPRRFDPRRLPAGLVQVIGHTGHSMCRRELHIWSASTPSGPVSVRTLHSTGQACSYREGVHAPEPGAATVYLVDPEFWSTPIEAVQFLSLEAVHAPS